tara:strand:+ start:787 stop:1896 length:1110 start_codon:yes stop_codon:yes gene_type:complete
MLLNKIFCILVIFILNISIAASQENKKKCRINTNKQILDFIKKELKPFNSGSNEEGPRLSQSDLKLLEIKHYSDQLKDSREMRMDILSFSTLNKQDLEIFNKFSSKIKLVLSDCSEVVFFGDNLLGAYELPYDDMLKAFTLASKNNNEIILNFIRNQVTPKSIGLYDAINILMNDFATQQNIIMELLSEEVKKVFFGENNMVATTDVAEARLLSFSLLGGEILDAKDKLLFFILPKTYKGVKSSIGTLVLDIDGNLYEIPNLNYILSVNILSGLGVNTRTLTMSEVISDSGSCRIDLAGNWMHKVNGIEIRGCPFNSISKKMLQQGSHRNSRDYKSYKAVFEEIDNINFNTNNNSKSTEEKIGAPAQGQ